MDKPVYRPRKTHYYAFGWDMKAYVKLYQTQKWVVEKWNYNAQKVLLSSRSGKGLSIEVTMSDLREYFVEVKDNETKCGD